MAGHAAIAALCLLTCATIALGMPGFGHGLQVWYLLAGVALIGLTLWRTAPILAGLQDRPLRISAIVALILVGLFTWGAATQVVIDGKVYLSTSSEARSWRLTEEVRDDLEKLQTADELLALDIAGARARFAEYDTAADQMRDLSAKWARKDLAALPDPRFLTIAQNMKVAAYWASEGIDRKRVLLTQDDARLLGEMEKARATMIEAALTAGGELKVIADELGFELLDGGAE